MSSTGAEAFRAAIRRAIPLVVGLMLLGALVVNGLSQLRGARYEASAQVLISSTPLSSIITGTEPGFVDPQRTQDTARVLAGSPGVYSRAARGGDIGSSSELHDATTVQVGGSNDILTFVSTAGDPRRAQMIVNRVAQAYIAFRNELTQATIAQTSTQLRNTINTLPAGSPERATAQRQLNRLEVLRSANSGDAIVVSPATSADQTNPAPLRDTLLGLSLGLVIALMLVALREAIDTKVRDEADVERLLDAPVLTAIKPIPRGSRLVTYGRHEASFADSYSMLAAQLMARPAPNGTGLLMAVTSAAPREGKTTTSVNLAVALARRGLRVILADFDLRKPSLTEVFGLAPDTPGAIEVMQGERDIDECLWSVAVDGPQPTVTRNGARPEAPDERTLQVLPAGGALSARGEAKLRRPLAALLEDLRGRASVVVLDTPPALLTAEMTELARSVDLVVLVARQGVVSQRSLRLLRRQGRDWHAEIAGVVITDAPGQKTYDYYGRT
jgi:Mrp family chromosome partitioning ATPase